MTNHPRRQATKLCYFCGAPGDLTKEHAWPQWLGGGAEVPPTQSTRILGFGRTGENELTETPTVVVTKPGSVLTSRVREVCRGCNGGWMSRLEVAVEPLLRRLWSPSYPLGYVTVSPDEAGTIATWATKTAWVRELLEVEPRTPTPKMRLYLKEQQLPPEFTRVWVARYAGQSNFGASLAHVQAAHQDDSWDAARHRKVLLCSLTFKGLAMIVRTDDGWGVPESTLPSETWRKIWPATEVTEWPPRRVASDIDLQLASQRLDWLRMPATTVFNRDPNGVRRIDRN